jgi:uncharacterized repeat protein (TIGR01451 family)
VTIAPNGIAISGEANIDPYTAGSLIVDDKSIAAGVTHTYRVTIEFTVAGSANSSDLDCDMTGQETGTGSLNTATVTFNGQSKDATDCAPVPSLKIDKTVTSPPSFSAGTWSITYQVAVENDGPVGTTYDLVDVPSFGGGVTVTRMTSGALVDTTAPFSLQLATGKPIASTNPNTIDTYGVTVEFTVSGSATSADLDCEKVGQETGTGTLNEATATFDGKTIKDDACAPVPRLEITKTASPDSYAAVGQVITYTIEAKNTGGADLFDVDITDDLIPNIDADCTVGGQDVSLPVGSLGPGESIICTGTYVIQTGDVGPGKTVDNTACVETNAVSEDVPVSEEQPYRPSLEACDDEIVHAILIDITKTVSPTTLAEPGGVFTYTLRIHNPSAVAVVITSLTDTNSGLSPNFAANCGILLGQTLEANDNAAGGPDEKTCTYTVTRTIVGSYINTAVVTAKFKEGTGPQATDQDSKTVTVTGIDPKIEVIKDVDQSIVVEGGSATFTFTVRNISNEPVELTSLTDSAFGVLAGDADCKIRTGNQKGTGTILQPGASCSFQQTFKIPGAGGTAHTNVFTAIAEDDEGTPTSDTDDAVVRIHPPINILIEKTPNPDVVESGAQEQVTFTISFRHNLPFTIYLVSITDSDFGNLLAGGRDLVSNGCAATDPGFALLANTTYTCQFVAVIDGPEAFIHENTVRITATDVQAAAFQQRSIRASDVLTHSDIDVSPPDPNKPQFATWEDTAQVRVFSGGGQGGGGGAGDQPPTDMLTFGDHVAAQGGNPLDGTTSWALWVLLTAMLIVSGAWVIRKQRFAEARS